MRNALTLSIAGVITVIVGFFSYALFVGLAAAMLAPLAMLALGFVSSYSEGVVPALGYVESFGVLYVLLLAALLPPTMKRPAPRS